jgi:predicted peroxiredoxin
MQAAAQSKVDNSFFIFVIGVYVFVRKVKKKIRNDTHSSGKK